GVTGTAVGAFLARCSLISKRHFKSAIARLKTEANNKANVPKSPSMTVPHTTFNDDEEDEKKSVYHVEGEKKSMLGFVTVYCTV
ncbi:hypothetical protein A2U01_0019417, partial [Trifolium medium]|nr:hypothetical protein [Trifolium medium]